MAGLGATLPGVELPCPICPWPIRLTVGVVNTEQTPAGLLVELDGDDFELAIRAHMAQHAEEE